VSLFTSGPGQIIFYAVYLSTMFVAPVAAVIIRRRHSPALKARFPLGGTARARLSAVLIFLLIAILFGYAAIGLLPDWAYYLGLSLSLLGFAIWLWGQQTLGAITRLR